MPTKRSLGNVAAAEIDNALMELQDIFRAAQKLATGNITREESLALNLKIVIHARNAERALRNAKAPRPE